MIGDGKMKIELKGVRKEIKHTEVLKPVTYEFEEGHIYGIVGKNGTGKTMLLRLIAGLIKPTEGSVIVNGKELWKEIDFPEDMGLFIEKPQYLEYLTGLENLKLIAEIKRIVTEAEIQEYMKQFSLDAQSKKIMKHYSLGMKQKVGIIQAIMENPKILILDEPFNALDSESVNLFREILLERKKNGALVILTSHHQDDIESVCDKMIEL